MKLKLLGIMIGIMLLAPLLTVAQPQHPLQQEHVKNKPVKSSYSADVPVWEIGDTWTYKIEDMALNLSEAGRQINLNLDIGTLPLIVTDTTGEYYTLTFDTTMNGQGRYNTDQGYGAVNISISFTAVELTGSVRIEKSTLGIKELSASVDKQKFTFELLEQPFLPLPAFLKKITSRISMNVTTNSDSPKTLLTFPLDTETVWNSTAANISVDGNIQSIWFNILYLVNTIGSLFGMEILPSDIAALLPIININDALTTLIGGNVFQIPSIPYAFYCLNTENITTPAGPFEAFNITLIGGVAQCYFAPDAGNIVKISGDLAAIFPRIQRFDMELLSTTFS